MARLRRRHVPFSGDTCASVSPSSVTYTCPSGSSLQVIRLEARRRFGPDLVSGEISTLFFRSPQEHWFKRFCKGGLPAGYVVALLAWADLLCCFNCLHAYR